MSDWTPYGKSNIFATGFAGVPRSALWVALFSTSADPAGPPIELVLAGYARQQVFFDLTGTDNAANTFDVVFGPLAAGAYTGVGIFDDAVAGGCWMWHDESGPITIIALSTVDFPAGQITAVRV